MKQYIISDKVIYIFKYNYICLGNGDIIIENNYNNSQLSAN